jgi:transposase
MSASPDTLLRLIRQYDPSCSASPRVLGVDDWAYRRGQVYGTILCDLEQQSVIDLLPDREAETLSQWLKNHPEIEIVSRDRATVYIEGITSGAPQALQVADRWHLLKNLRPTTRYGEI